MMPAALLIAAGCLRTVNGITQILTVQWLRIPSQVSAEQIMHLTNPGLWLWAGTPKSAKITMERKKWPGITVTPAELPMTDGCWKTIPGIIWTTAIWFPMVFARSMGPTICLTNPALWLPDGMHICRRNMTKPTRRQESLSIKTLQPGTMLTLTESLRRVGF